MTIAFRRGSKVDAAPFLAPGPPVVCRSRQDKPSHSHKSPRYVVDCAVKIPPKRTPTPRVGSNDIVHPPRALGPDVATRVQRSDWPCAAGFTAAQSTIAATLRRKGRTPKQPSAGDAQIDTLGLRGKESTTRSPRKTPPNRECDTGYTRASATWFQRYLAQNGKVTTRRAIALICLLSSPSSG